MPFRAKNVYHLRLTSQDVLPLYVYLDDRHIDWMTNATLKAVVTDLRPLIGAKLEAERNAHFGPGGPANVRRPTVEVHRGTGYQFAYFLRKADPYAVVLKARNYTLPPSKPKQSLNAPLQSEGKRKRSSPTIPSEPKRPRKTSRRKSNEKDKSTEIILDSEEGEESPLSELDSDEPIDQPSQAPRRRSTRTQRQVAGGYREDSEDEESGNGDAEGPEHEQTEEAQVQPPAGDPPSMVIDEDEEEEKPKPVMQVAFRNLTMRDRCLCVVVEPWPPLPMGALSRAPSVAPATQTARTPSIAPPDFVSSIPEREETPLFLPDFDRRSATPAPVRFGSVVSTLQTMDEDQDSIADDNFGMLAFSQMLNSVAGENTGGVEEDDEIDGSVLYGDADETRGIVQ